MKMRRPRIILRELIVTVDGVRKSVPINEKIPRDAVYADEFGGVTFDFDYRGNCEELIDVRGNVVVARPRRPVDWPRRDGLLRWSIKWTNNEDSDGGWSMVGYVGKIDRKCDGPHAAVEIHQWSRNKWRIWREPNAFFSAEERRLGHYHNSPLLRDLYSTRSELHDDIHLVNYRTPAKARRVARAFVEQHTAGQCPLCFATSR